MTEDPWFETDIATLQTAMQCGELSAVELVTRFIQRIDTLDSSGPTLNAIQHINERALADAEALDAARAAGQLKGPLHGIPLLVKDNYETQAMPTTAGSVLFAGFHPQRDATLVARLRAAGAVILAKATMHEFAYGITTVGSAFGSTRNPYDLTRNPGGSSGGTGAAVAAGFAVAGFGSDTCGSIRIPAAQNNLFGMRPTQGFSSRHGIVPLSSTQDIGGPLARNVADLSLLLALTAGYDPADAQTSVMRDIEVNFTGLIAREGVRVGVMTDWMRVDADDDAVASVVTAALQAMQREAGWQLVDTPSPRVDASVDRAWNGHVVLIADFGRDINAYLAANPELGIQDLADLLSRELHHDDISASMQASLAMANADEIYAQELAQRDVVRGALLELMAEHQLDVLAYPSIRRTSAKLGEEQYGTNCRLAANSGCPAISIPAGFASDGMPVGLELLGAPHSERLLLELALTVEQRYPQRRPPTLHA